jgi:hypothetical protein
MGPHELVRYLYWLRLWEHGVRLAAGLQSLAVIVARATTQKLDAVRTAPKRQFNPWGIHPLGGFRLLGLVGSDECRLTVVFSESQKGMRKRDTCRVWASAMVRV